MRSILTIDFIEARTFGEHALEYAFQAYPDRPVAVCVVGATGDTLWSGACDGVKSSSIKTAYQKAWTVVHRQVRSTLAHFAGWDAKDVLAAIAESPDFVSWGGGVAIEYEGVIIGAIGVSGLKPEEDDDVASSPPDNWDRLIRDRLPA